MLTGTDPFVGREAALTYLDTAAAEAFDGDAQMLVVAGEAGIGKSALVRHWLDALGPDVAWAVGHCVEGQRPSLAHAPLLGLLRELRVRLGVAAEPLVSVLDQLVGAEDAAPGGTAGGEARLFEAVLEGIGHLTADRPLVMVVEDVHWADASTASLLGFLAHNLTHERVAVLLTARDGTAASADGVALLTALTRLRVPTVRLGPLEETDVASLAAAHLRRQPTSSEVAALWERAEGNPFFTTELVLSGPLNDQLPMVLQQVLDAELARLPNEAARVLRAASVLGRTVPLDALASLVELPADTVADAVRAAVDARFLHIDRDGVRFAHALFVEAVDRTLLPNERRRLHGLVVDDETILAAVGADPAARAHHLRGAGRRAEALVAAAEGAAQAEQMAAPGDALRHWSGVLELLDEVEDGESLIATTRLAVALRASACASDAGHHDQALALAHHAAALLSEHAGAATRAQVEHRLGRCRFALGDPAAAAAHLRAAAALAETAPPERATLEAVAACTSLLASTGQGEEALALTERALGAARALGADDLVLQLRRDRAGAVAYARSDPFAAATELLDVCDGAVAAGLPLVACGALSDVAWVQTATSEPGDALATAERGFMLAREAGLERSEGARHLALASFHLATMGRWREVDENLALAPRWPGWPAWLTSAMLAAAEALAAGGRGDHRRAARALERQRTAMPDATIATVHASFALADATSRMAAGDPDGALATVVDIALEHRPPGWLQHGAWLASIGIAACHQLGARAAGSVDALHALASEQATLLGAVGAHRSTGVAFAAVCDAWTDPRHWERAITALDELGLRPAALDARLQWARCLLADGEREQASSVLQDAARQAEVLGAIPAGDAVADIAQRARLDLRTRGLGQQRTVADAYGLTAREQEVLALVAGGLTNAEVGDRLFISTKTASVHVTNLLRKLGVANRREAARLAVDVGLVDDRRRHGEAVAG